MGFIADEPLGDLLDEQGLDHAGKSLRAQQRKAQAIDRDLPVNIGYDAGEDDHIADAFGGVDYDKLIRQAQAQRDAIKDTMGINMRHLGSSTGRATGKAMTATDLKRFQDSATGRDRFTIKGKYAHLNGQELEQEFHNARAAGQGNIAEEIANEAIRRDKEGKTSG